MPIQNKNNKDNKKKIIKRVKKARSNSNSNKEYQYEPVGPVGGNLIEKFLTTIDMNKIIKEASTAAEISTLGDAVVVGSALISKIAANLDAPETAKNEIVKLLTSMRHAMDQQV